MVVTTVEEEGVLMALEGRAKDAAIDPAMHRMVPATVSSDEMEKSCPERGPQRSSQELGLHEK